MGRSAFRRNTTETAPARRQRCDEIAAPLISDAGTPGPRSARRPRRHNHKPRNPEPVLPMAVIEPEQPVVSRASRTARQGRRHHACAARTRPSRSASRAPSSRSPARGGRSQSSRTAASRPSPSTSPGPLASLSLRLPPPPRLLSANSEQLMHLFVVRMRVDDYWPRRASANCTVILTASFSSICRSLRSLTKTVFRAMLTFL
jgi:hypothetical protein